MSDNPESPGIGLYAESGLHAALKAVYAARSPEARVEACVAGKIVDVVLPDEFVEVQTRDLRSLVGKVLILADLKPVRIVHPVPARTVIERLDPRNHRPVSRRRSPARRDLYSVFDELVHASRLVAAPNVRFDLVFVHVLEQRVRDGSGSWRRRGDRILSRELTEIISTTSFDSRVDWLALIPAELAEPYDSEGLGAALGIGADQARKILYVYAKAGLLCEIGREGRRKRYVIKERAGK